MERQAQQTDRAVHQLGRNLDSVGAKSQVTQIERTSQRMHGLASESQRVERQTHSTTRAMGTQTRQTRQLGDAVARLGSIFRGLGSIMKPAKFASIIAVIKPLIGIVGALAGGLAALLPKMVDLAGVAGALPATFAGIGLAVVTAKFAFAGLQKALHGNKNAIKALTPEGRQLLTTLKQYKPVIEDLRRTAQKGLFPGIDYAIRRLQRGVPLVRSLLARMSRELGRQAGSWADFLTGNTNMRDLAQIGQQGTRIFARISQGAQNLARALIIVTRAAAPFTEWLTKRLLHGTENIRKMTKAAADSGRLGRYFDRARQALTRFWSIIKSAWSILRSIGRASRQLGDDLWNSADRGLKGWAKFLASARGQRGLKAWFDGLRPTLHELGGLVADLGGLFYRATGPSAQRQTAGMVHQLRDWVPVIEKILNSATAAFGPAVLDAIKEMGRVVALLFDHAGPLTMLLQSLTQILSMVNNLVQVVPGLGRILQAAFTVFAVNKLIGRMSVLAGLMKIVSGGAPAAVGAAEGAALGTAAGVGAGALAARSLVGTGTGAAAVGGVTEAGVLLPAGVTAAEAGAGVVAGGGAALGAKGALGAAGRFALPIAALLAGLGAMQGARSGGIGNIAQGAGSSLSMGLIHAPLSPEAKIARQQDKASRFVAGLDPGMGPITQGRNIKALAGETSSVEQQYANLVGGGRYNKAEEEGLRTRLEALRGELHLRRQNYNELKRQMAAEAEQRSRDHGRARLQDLGKAYDIYAGKYGQQGAFHRTVTGALDSVRSMHGPGARVVAENTLQWAQQQAKGNPKMLAEVDRLKRGIVARFRAIGGEVQIVNGRILTGTQSEWEGIRKAMSSKAEKALQEVSGSFTQLQQRAVGSLVAMGYSQGQAKQIVQGLESGGTKGTRAAADATSGPTGAGQRPTSSDASRPTASVFGTGDGWGSRIGGPTAEDRAARAGTATSNSNATGGLMGAKPGLGIYASDASGYGLSVSSGLRQGAITSAGNVSYHSSGDAIDLAGSPDNMMRFAQHAADVYGPHLEELIYSPLGFSIKNGKRVAPYAVADHYDHVHMADTAPTGAGAGGGTASLLGGGGGGLGQISLTGSQSSLGGVPGAMSTAASGAMAAGLTAALNQRLAGGGAAGGAPGGGSARAIGRQMLAAQGFAASEWNPLNLLWTRESGWNPNAVNPSSGAYGIPQSLGHGHPYNLGDTSAQVSWGLDYIRGRYGTPSAAWAHEQSVGWYGGGGDFIATRPQVIGVGDGGRERVTVTPSGKGGASQGTGAMHVDIHINGGDPKEVEQAVHRALRKVATEANLIGLEEDGVDG